MAPKVRHVEWYDRTDFVDAYHANETLMFISFTMQAILYVTCGVVFVFVQTLSFFYQIQIICKVAASTVSDDVVEAAV